MASSSFSAHVFRYDVFVSFRGEDTRNSFTSHLLKALDGKKVVTYTDYKLENGDEIAPALWKAIEESRISVIIFSENYASSPWCLDELVHILECKERYQQFVIPIFYRVNPAHVRQQRESYAAAFSKHEERFKDRMDKVLKWKGALTIAANLSGFDSHAISNESELVERIVKAILMNLDRQSSSDLTGLVGVESRIQKIESLICISPQDVQVLTVGIWGMGGIGKTTLAGAVFNRLSSHFEASCFLANVREESEKCGMKHLRNELLRELLKEDSLSIGTPSIGSTFVNKRLSLAKVLVVLDDVNVLNQLEYLVGDQVQFGPGSRIIITTRDMQLLKDMQVLRKGVDHDVKIYEVQKLNCNEALQLFHLHASQEISLGEDSTMFLRAVVDYAAGIPLALQIWGSLFRRCKSKQERESLLNKLKIFPDKKLLNVYRISYDALDENEREIFLNIACFHKEEVIDDAKRQLDACGLFADSGIKILIDMSLISIKHEYGRNCLWMHDVIQEMGWAIVHEQCPEEPGKRSRLWNLEDVYHVLARNTGTEKVQSISVNLSKVKELNLRSPDFKKMYNLRFLKFYRRYHVNQCNVSLNLKSLPSALRYLCWPAYPLKSLPSKFSSENLVELSMPNSQLQRLWNGGQNPRNLKRIDLRYSKQLVEVPDLSKSVNIEGIDLRGCIRLVEVPSYFEFLHKLASLNLSHCSNLRFLSDMPHNMKFLNLDNTAVEELPSSIFSLEKLVELNLECCEGIKNLPNSTWKLNSLTSLYLCGTSIEGLPLSIECLSGVVSFQLKFCKRLVSLPTSICKLKSLERLSLEGCSSFKHFPEILEPMQRLEDLSLSLTDIKELPSSIENLVGLKRLRLYECKSLESVPNSIYNLNLAIFALDGCCRLKTLPPSSVILWSSIRGLDLHGCLALEEIPDCIYSLTSIWRLDLSESMIKSISPTIKQASGLRFLYVSNCKCLQSLPELPYLLKVLDASGCTKLKTVSRSMTALTQGLEEILDRHEQHLFYDCVTLDENARSNIVDDAYLRIMRTATANYHASLLKKCQSEGSEFSDEKSPSVAVVCPGDELPKWLSYQTEGCSIKVKLPLTWCHDANFLGLALCAVVTTHNPCWLDYGFNFVFKTINGESHQFNHCARTYERARTGWGGNISDHLFVWYDSLEEVWSTDFNNAIEASFEFFAQNKRHVGGVRSAVGYCCVKGVESACCLLTTAQMLKLAEVRFQLPLMK
ncbi:hypothetical protein M0R45_027359 [Rubus argutus]|uniref:ADP-ribosyl cyclase/cyclic ADP-ribose hydrolase n=1 Tax=Rubus argutus TaxID=59490 RepID=A0AAW1X073_RUBAR